MSEAKNERITLPEDAFLQKGITVSPYHMIEATISRTEAIVSSLDLAVSYSKNVVLTDEAISDILGQVKANLKIISRATDKWYCRAECNTGISLDV